MRKVAAVGLAWGVAFCSSGAGAQTVQAAQADTQAPGPRASVSQANADTSAIPDIVVTAQRRAESISRAPLAITAVTGEQLQAQGIVDANSLQSIAPSLNVQDRGSGANIAIRGVVTVNPNPQGDPAVALTIDDIYVARPNAATTDFLDVARVEVLRGPQGTVYGRNATGGAINVISNLPTFTVGGEASVEAGSLGTINASGVLNMPVSDTVALRGAVSYNKHDGYIGHFDDKDDVSARLRLLVKPSDRGSFLLTGFYNHRGGVGPADVLYPYLSADPRANTVYPDDFGKRRSDYYGFSAKYDLDIGFADLTYIGGYTHYREDSDIAQLGSLSTAHYRSDQITQELRLASATSAVHRGDVSWLVGVYFFNEDQSYANVITQPLALKTYTPVLLTSTTNEPKIDATSIAGFAQATYSLTDALRVTGGIRYTHDDKSQSGSQSLKIGPNPAVLIPATGARGFSNVSYRAAVEADLTRHVLAYASVTTGYHAGALTEGPPGFNSYDSETITSYEAGLRNRFLDDRLQLNVTGYYYDYKNYQSQQIRPPFFPTPFNAKKARIYGGELEGVFRFNRRDQLSFTVAYENARFLNFSVPASVFTGDATVYNAAQNAYVYDGFDFPFVSPWSGTASYSHRFDLGNAGTLRLDASTSWRTAFSGYLSRSPLARIDGFTTSDASLTFSPHGRRLDVSGFVRNLEDSLRPSGSTIIMGKAYRSFAPPRTYGARVTVRF